MRDGSALDAVGLPPRTCSASVQSAVGHAAMRLPAQATPVGAPLCRSLYREQ